MWRSDGGSSGPRHPWGFGGLPRVLSAPCRQPPPHNLKTFHDSRHQLSPGLYGDSLSRSSRREWQAGAHNEVSGLETTVMSWEASA